MPQARSHTNPAYLRNTAARSMPLKRNVTIQEANADATA